MPPPRKSPAPSSGNGSSDLRPRMTASRSRASAMPRFVRRSWPSSAAPEAVAMVWRPKSSTDWCSASILRRSSPSPPTRTSISEMLAFDVASGNDLATSDSLSHMREIEGLDRQTFVERLGFLFEGSPWIAAEAWDSRPWRTRDALHAALLEVVARASQERQLALIRAHPDLVGQAAIAGTLTRESTAEQRAAGLDPDGLSQEEFAWFQDANAKYQAKFGFPFVICARENKKTAVTN